MHFNQYIYFTEDNNDKENNATLTGVLTSSYWNQLWKDRVILELGFYLCPLSYIFVFIV